MKAKAAVITLAAVLCLLTAGSAWGKVIYVDDDAPAGGDGTSWTAAYTFVQDALAGVKVAEESVEIRVAQGIYKPDRDMAHPQGGPGSPSTFELTGDVSLRGGFGGIIAPDPNLQDISVFESILTGDRDDNDCNMGIIARMSSRERWDEPTHADNSGTVVEISGLGVVLLEGFTVTGGFTSSGGAVYGLPYGECGAGVLIYDHEGEAILRDCRITGNFAEELGGGIDVFDANSIRVENCTITSNVAGWGGGMSWMDATRVELIRCVFTDNWAWDGGAVTVYGDSSDIAHPVCCAYVSGCVFSGNVASSHAGGFLVCCGDSVLVTEITNCVFEGNSVVNPSSGIAVRTEGDAKLTLRNSILRNNWCWTKSSGSPAASDDTTIEATYCNIEGGWSGEGNIDTDPFYACPGCWNPNASPNEEGDNCWVGGDYHLKSQAGRWDPSSASWVLDDVTSPCIDAGDPNSPIGDEPFPNGGRINMGAYGGTAEASKSYAED
ncbi:MAG: right-handed parallel beta-helix repeat-containing protein [Phycisphaerae bacterium]|nr:right-handed parallel beta-helix repeat-containing protein [Phycisphaerae bacterium]